MSLDLMLLSAYLGFNAIIWITLYSISREHSSYEKPPQGNGDQENMGRLQRVSILIPLYLEKPESILRTASSIAKQRYPRELYDVWFIVEEEDLETLRGAEKALEILRSSGVEARIHIVRGGRSSKARALNQVMGSINSNIVAVYDADDTFEENQLEEAVRLMSHRGYDALGVRVYRYGGGVLGKLIYIDTVVWFDLIINALRRAGLHVPLSGEGLYVRRDVLERLGGFPERLAEDAYLSLLLFERGYSIGLLDSYVEEAAPLGVLSHIRQRIRWYRGHLECIVRILIYGGGRRFGALVGYLGPVIAATSLVISIITIMVTATHIVKSFAQDGGPGFDGNNIHNNIHTLIPRDPVLVALLLEGLLPLLIIMLAVLNNKGPRRGIGLSIYVFAMPLYWILMSFAAIPSILMRRVEWYRTRRTAE